MSPYLAVLRARFRMLLQYRAAAIAGVGTQLFWGLIRVMIFEAFYHSTSAPQPMSRADVVSYCWLGQALLGLIMWNVDTDVRALIRTGTVAYELVRPLDLYSLWFSRAVAARLAPTLLRCIPIFLIAGLFLGLRAPASPASAAAWLAAEIGALLLGAAMSTLVTVSLLWTVAGDGMSRLVPELSYVLSGMLVPIPLLPLAFQRVVNVLPFRDMMDAPFRLYLGHMPAEQLWAVLAHQAAWIAVLVLAGRLLLFRGTRRLVVQGG